MASNPAGLRGAAVFLIMLLAPYPSAHAQDGFFPCNCPPLPSSGHTLPQDDPFWDEIGRYFQRIDGASLVSGDARQVNAVTHIIDPWPRYARNKRIPANGQRMVGAIDRYQNPKLLGAKAPTLAPVIMQTLTGAPGGEGGATPGAGYGGGQ